MRRIIAIISLLIFLVGCATLSGGGNGATRESLDAEFRKGSEGLSMSFLPNTPPSRLFDTQPFTATVSVENKGTFPIGGAGDRVYLSGFDPSIITGIPLQGEPLEDLEGRSIYNPNQGSIDYVHFKGLIQPLGDTDKYDATLLATACYGYKTKATANVCVDTNPFSTTNERKVCTPQPVSLGDQGAPIAVTEVRVEASPKKTVFRVFVANVGPGTPFRSPGLLPKCNPYSGDKLSYEETNYVTLESVEVFGITITPSCKPGPEIILVNGQGSFVCTLEHDFSATSAFTSPFNVVLSYGYMQSIQQGIEIIPG